MAGQGRVGGGVQNLGGQGFSLANMFSGFGSNVMDFGKNVGSFLGSKSGQGLMDFGSLALQGYGLNKSIGFAQDELGILKEQENRAATAQNFGTNNSLAMQLQMTTPGSAERAQVEQAIAEQQYAV